MEVKTTRERPLADRLVLAGRAFQAEQGKSFFCRSVKYILGVFVVLFVLDVVFHFGAQPRAIFSGLLALGVMSVVAVAWYIAWVRRASPEHVARRLEMLEPSLGSRVINVLQLEKIATATDLRPLTRELAAKAVEQYARELRNFDFLRIARLPRLRRDLRRALWAGGAFLTVILLTREISLLEMARFADPYGDHPPYSFTQLVIAEPSEKGSRVHYGKSVLVKVKYSGHQPRELFLTFHDPRRPGKNTTVPMFSNGKQGFSQQIENIKSDLAIVAHTANHHSLSKSKLIQVVLTPRIEKGFLKISPPAYTGLKPQESLFDFKTARALEGSQVQIKIQSNRPLREGSIGLSGSGKSARRVPMKRLEENEVVGTFQAAESGRLGFGVVDVDGIATEEPMGGILTVTHDLPPEISITQPNRDCLVCLDYAVEMRIEAADDYGLKTVRIHQAINGIHLPPKIIRYEKITRAKTEVMVLDLQDMGVEPGDVISVFAEAIDTSPAGNVARTENIRMTVISEEDYNKYLREEHDITDMEGKYMDLLDRFRDQIDAQKQLGENIDELRKKSRDNLENAAEKMEDLAEEQSGLNAELNDLAEELDSFVRQNPTYDVESEFQRMLSDQAQKIRESTATNQKQLKDIAGQKPGTESLSNLKKASDEQLKKLAGTEGATREQVKKTFEDLGQMQQLVNDFNQFEQLYRTQQALTEQNRPYNTNAPLSREDQLALRGLASTEKNVEDQLRQLSEKLRQDAQSAKSKFPNAAKSAEELARSIDKQRMPPLASEATGSMLKGDGENSYQLAERLRSEMEKPFSQGESQSGDQGQELGDYLKLQRQMSAGKTLDQMKQSRKFAHGSGKQGKGGESGQGQSGSLASNGPSNDVLGGETMITRMDEASGASDKSRRAERSRQNGAVQLDKTDIVKGLNPVNRKSEAVTSEAPLGEYDDLVDRYFKAITK